MKYFTKEMWAGWQSRDADVRKATNESYKQNSTSYREQLPSVATKLGESGAFFTDEGLHDGHLLELAIRDQPVREEDREYISHQTSIKISVLSGDDETFVFTLHYEGIKDISIATPNDLFTLSSSQFGDWGYDELFQEPDGSFRHNILFQTGTELSIAFTKFSFTKTPAPPEPSTSDSGE